MTPPSSSSDGEARPALAAADDAPGAGLRALAARLAAEFGADASVFGRVAELYAQVQERAPDLYVPAAEALAGALARAARAGEGAAEAVHLALGEWALEAESEPIERMRRDCLRFQEALARGALRLYASDPERLAASLLAVQRFVFVQLALLASAAARGPEAGGVVRTLPTPEYAAFMEILRTAMETHRRSGAHLALLVIDVGRVAQVDRLLGLQRGEAFMLRVTRRMREGVLRRQDQLGRVSRSEIACLLPGIAGEGVAILAANKILGALEAPVPIGEQSFAPDAAIGIALYPGHGEDPQALVRNAKLAARAARAGSERVALYDPGQGAEEERRVRDEARLRDALEQNALALAFEPQLDPRSAAPRGLACTLCWRDAELGEVPEARAIEAAESAGMIRELTSWLFNNALREGAELARRGLALPIAVRVTAGGLLQPDFPEFVDRALRTWRAAPERLTIGVQEAALAAGTEPVRAILERLHALGVRLGLCDFGAGAMPLSALAQLPLDEIELGPDIVADMQRVELHARIARSLVQLARSLGLRVAAAGVPDAVTAAALAALGCERIRGAAAGRALSAQEALERFGPQP